MYSIFHGDENVNCDLYLLYSTAPRMVVLNSAGDKLIAEIVRKIH
jgi:hypothetical protein